MTVQETASYLEGYAEALAGACATGRRLTRDELASLRGQGERTAEAGIGLRYGATDGGRVAVGRAHPGREGSSTPTRRR
ncbi:hypothetical protein SAMN05444921_102198 [Streptomyces wuyuanensis]|uniref:Uncharacterized protein n=1 Tax=Streptomyces wuyuanensis TaxID=1196353 RepID=A0A1G9NZR6_9ACTN|nr:hypothetical protein SAMN05444921_102198 [Streptomyces wuyuanensis]